MKVQFKINARMTSDGHKSHIDVRGNLFSTVKNPSFLVRINAE